MHVKSLKVFCDVVGRRSFSRAADENGLSQSGVSQMVHQIEEHLGVKLIDRSKRPFVLTPAGEVYYDGCRKIVHQLAALEEDVRSLHQQVSGRVSVASIYSIGLSHMQRFVETFAARHPQAQVQVEYHHPRRIYELVEAGQVDFGLVSYPKSSRTIAKQLWREEPMVLVCAPEHTLAAESSVSVEQLSGREIVAFESELIIRRRIDQALAARRVEVSVAMEFDNIETLKRAIEINAGFSLLPLPTVTRELDAGTLVKVPIRDFEMSRPLGIIQRRGHALGKTGQRFLAMLRAAAGENGAGSHNANDSGEVHDSVPLEDPGGSDPGGSDPGGNETRLKPLPSRGVNRASTS